MREAVKFLLMSKLAVAKFHSPFLSHPYLEVSKGPNPMYQTKSIPYKFASVTKLKDKEEARCDGLHWTSDQVLREINNNRLPMYLT